MTDDWPTDPSALARALDDAMAEVLVRPMSQGGKQYPKHVPAADVSLGERQRPTPSEVDATTTLCAAYNSERQYSLEVRKPIDTQRNREHWCKQCAAIVADLPNDENFAVPVEAGAVADGGDVIREQGKHGDDPCPLCGKEYDGHLPIHIREECEEKGEL